MTAAGGWDAARADVTAFGLLLRADAVPGARTAVELRAIVPTFDHYLDAREALRVAQHPDLDPGDDGRRDAAWLAARRQDYREALTAVRTEVAALALALEYAADEDDLPPLPATEHTRETS